MQNFSVTLDIAGMILTPSTGSEVGRSDEGIAPYAHRRMDGDGKAGEKRRRMQVSSSPVKYAATVGQSQKKGELYVRERKPGRPGAGGR